MPVPAGIEMRGWIATTYSSGFRVVWDAPQASGRLGTGFLTQAYPAAVDHRLVRQPSVAKSGTAIAPFQRSYFRYQTGRTVLIL